MKDYYLERESRLPVKARYDVLVAGSAVFGSPDPRACIEALRCSR